MLPAPPSTAPCNDNPSTAEIHLPTLVTEPSNSVTGKPIGGTGNNYSGGKTMSQAGQPVDFMARPSVSRGLSRSRSRLPSPNGSQSSGNFDGVPAADGAHRACTRRLANTQHPELSRCRAGVLFQGGTVTGAALITRGRDRVRVLRPESTQAMSR